MNTLAHVALLSKSKSSVTLCCNTCTTSPPQRPDTLLNQFLLNVIPLLKYSISKQKNIIWRNGTTVHSPTNCNPNVLNLREILRHWEMSIRCRNWRVVRAVGWALSCGKVIPGQWFSRRGSSHGARTFDITLCHQCFVNDIQI